MLAFVIAIAGLLLMHGRFDDLSDKRRAGPLWIAATMEFELLRMENSLLEFLRDESDVTADTLRFRFDILWSRVDIAMEGQNGVPAAAQSPAFTALKDLMGVLRKYDSAVQNLTGSETATAEALLADLRELLGPMREYSLAAKDEQALMDYTARQEFVRLSQAAIGIGAVIGLASALAAALFFLDARRYRRLSEEAAKLADTAQQASLAKSEFIATISHELRTPLTSAKGAIAILKEKIETLSSDRIDELLRIALRNGEKLHTLINDILDFEKLDMGKMNYHFEHVDLGDIVRSVVGTSAPYLEQAGLDCEVDIPERAIVLHGDKSRLEQVLNNLLSNAIKFSRRDERILVSVSAEDDRAYLKVQDFGAGIPEAFGDRVFERFVQADSSATRRVGGTGLGLSITRAIVEAHHGSITFTSEINVGTTFQVELPRLANIETQVNTCGAGIAVRAPQGRQKSIVYNEYSHSP